MLPMIIILALITLFAIIYSSIITFNLVCLFFNLIAFVILIVAGVFFYLNHRKRQKTVTQINPQNKVLSKKRFWIIFSCIAVIGILVRTVLFTVVPNGLEQDEASMLYDAFSLLHYGIDRNGTSFPVYMEAWGSGQNALLTYLTIPFVAMFGMNIFTARIVSLLFSIGSIFAFYYLLKLLTKNQKLALVGMAFFAICPYTIMIGRWGLESNLLPHMLLYSSIFLVKSNENLKYLFPTCILFGITLYAYAIAYMYVPLILVCFYVYFIVKKKINRKNLWIFICSNIILFLIALPLILFLLVNWGWLGDINIGVISIHKMARFRASELGVANLWNKLKALFEIFVLQNSHDVHHNQFYNLGFLYMVSLPFMIYGLLMNIKNLRKTKCEFNEFYTFIMFVCAFLITLIIKVDITKINIIWLSVIIYICSGVYYFIKDTKVIFTLTSIAFALLFSCFCGLYFTKYEPELNYQFHRGLPEAITYAKEVKSCDKIYFLTGKYDVTFYVYCLVIDNKSPDEFLETRVLDFKSRDYKVISYGKYYFFDEIDTIEEGKIYILQIQEFENKFAATVSNDNYKIFDNYVVIY